MATMLPYTARDLAAAFRTVRKNTLQIAEEIPEASYGFSAAPGTRTIAQILVHISLVDRLPRLIHGERRTTLQGFDFPAFMAEVHAEEQKPRSKAEIISLLKTSSDTYGSFLESLSDDFLAERVSMPQGMQPPSKTRFEMLMSVKEHEMHHRGQLMLVQRMVGMTPHLTRQMQERMAARA